jgi:uncharacterized repeat protein (TIGR01451 family)
MYFSLKEDSMRRILFLVVALALCVSNVAPALARSINLPAAPPCDSTAPTSPAILKPDRSARPPGDSSLSIAPPTNRVQATAAYSYTGMTIITPTIDGVFSGQFVDGDGLVPGPGAQNSLSFVDEQLFDAADNVYWSDPSGGFYSWQPITMALWLDTNDDGIYQSPGDFLIVGAAISGTSGTELNGLNDSGTPSVSSMSPFGFSPFVFNDVEFMYASPSKANNKYDPGEDIFYIGGFFLPLGQYVDRIGEFRGGQQILAYDPANPLSPPIAHIYWTQDADYLYFHNDFLVDAVAPYYDFEAGPYLAGNNGFIDADGTNSTGSGIVITDRIGIDLAERRWFTPTDQIAWYDADHNSHWTPIWDALWQDNGNSVYGGGDSLIVSASGTLTAGITATAILDPAQFEFVYRDDNNSQSWNTGEDIWALSGDEIWDYNYFDNKVSWLIDGDGSATTGRGADDPARVDGDQWFDAEDQVYFYDANGDTEWTDGTDALWKDNNGNGTYQSGTDTLIRSDAISVPVGTAISMTLLQRTFVDGNGTTTNGAGSDDATRTGQTSFQATDQVYWKDADTSNDWSSGDSLWIDSAADGVYQTGDSVILSGTTFVSGSLGTLLTSGAHWIGFDDGEITYNGKYDSGEDISASNTRFAYDDFEVTPNWQYDLGEDIYDRDYLEIWTYAEGDNTNTDFDHSGFAPDKELLNRDIGFRVHLNGIRIDITPPITSTRTISDYDAPAGIQAAAGWGPSRGFVGPMFFGIDPAFAGFNRHYEYRLPRHGGEVANVALSLQAAKPQKPFEKQIIIIFPDCSVKITYIWKDIRQSSPGTYTGPSGQAYGSSAGTQDVWIFVDHPSPARPVVEIVKSDLHDPYWPGGQTMPNAPGTGLRRFPFHDVVVPNPIPIEIVAMSLTSVNPLGTPQTVAVQQSDPTININPFVTGLPSIQHLPPGGWVEFGVVTTPSSLPPANTRVINTVTPTTTTPGYPFPPAPPSDGTTVSPTIALNLFKISNPTSSITAGGRITYTVGYENQSPLVIQGIKITDTRPPSMTFNPPAWPVDSFFDVFYELPITPTKLMPGDRGQIRIVGTVSPTVQTGTRLTNTVTGTFYSPLGTTDTIVQRKGLDVIGLPTTSTIPIELVALELKSVTPINVGTRITTTVTPISVTQPITFNWQAVGQLPTTTIAGLSSSIVLTWTTPGTKVITVTASNVTNTKQVTGSIFIYTPPISVQITGPFTGTLKNNYTFTATIDPASTTVPVTYVWQTSGHAPVTSTSGLTSTATFSYLTYGLQQVFVTTYDFGGSSAATDEHDFTINYAVYLPIVLKNF